MSTLLGLLALLALPACGLNAWATVRVLRFEFTNTSVLRKFP